MSPDARRFAAGASWLYGYRWIERLLDFLSIVVLARILAPSDFGLVAIAASFVTIIEGLSAFDVNKVLIRSREVSRPLHESAWTLSVMRGLSTALIMLAIAPFIEDVRIGAVLAVLALSPIINGLANPWFVLFERNLDYSKLAFQTLSAKIVSFAVTVSLAIITRSYWSLVVGLLSGSLVTTILSYLLNPFRPRFSMARFPEIFGFSGWLWLTSLVTTLAMETDKIIVGRLLGVGDAGFYFMTQRVGVLPTRELVSPLQRMLLPSFSDMIRDSTRLRRVVCESINVLGSLSIPAGLGFAMVADDFVPLVLGDRWRPIVPLLQILVPYLGLRATLSTTLPCVMALGRTRLLFWVSFVYAFVHLPAFIAGTVLFGLMGAIISIVAAGVLYSYLNAWMLKVTLGISLRDILKQIGRPLAASLIMVVALIAFEATQIFDTSSQSRAWLSLILEVTVGCVAFGASLYSIWRLEGRPAGIERRLSQVLQRGD
ncbi:MAG: lipopolysaccharide biosynthesis protein [Thermoanaerobaculia bacterium]